MVLINKANHLVGQLKSRFAIFLLKLNKGININERTFIDEDTYIVTNNGGSISIGSDCEIMKGVCMMTYGGKISIGDRCSINPYTIIYGIGNGVTIGNDVLIAGHCMIVPSNHNFDDISLPINKQGWNSKGIVIEENVWIGGGSRILDGVKIGTGAIISAGSVVTKNVDSYVVVAGVPAKVIKNRQ